MNYLNKAVFKNAGVIHLRDFLVDWTGAEGRTSELEDIVIATSKTEKQREQNLKKQKTKQKLDNSRTMGQPQKM